MSGKNLGYDVDQVDALMERIRRQYENPKSRFVIASMLSSASFDLVPGGYSIEQVDKALAEVADDFERRDLERRIERLGRRVIQLELRSHLGTIRQVLAQDADKRFSPARNGFNKKLVRQLLKEVSVADGKLVAPGSLELRTRPLGRSAGGPSRSEVNEFISVIIATLHAQELLG